MGDKDKAVDRGKGADSTQDGFVDRVADYIGDKAEQIVTAVLPKTTHTLKGGTAEDREKAAGSK